MLLNVINSFFRHLTTFWQLLWLRLSVGRLESRAHHWELLQVVCRELLVRLGLKSIIVLWHEGWTCHGVLLVPVRALEHLAGHEIRCSSYLQRLWLVEAGLLSEHLVGDWSAWVFRWNLLDLTSLVRDEVGWMRWHWRVQARWALLRRLLLLPRWDILIILAELKLIAWRLSITLLFHLWFDGLEQLFAWWSQWFFIVQTCLD